MEPLTPDFYSYPWTPIESAVLHDDFVRVRWGDGSYLACYSLWLAENADGIGIDPTTREGLLEPGSLPPPDALVAASVGMSGELELTWRDGTVTHMHPGWLRHIADGAHAQHACLAPARAWTADSFSDPPSVDGSDVLTNSETLQRWLDLLCEFGLARLRNTPADDQFLRRLGLAIGPLRGSNFGDIFSVKSIIDPRPEENSTANTALGLGQHADLPTRETPPGFQFLHCVENTVAGGFSRMTDGLSVVDRLRTRHPDDYDALTTLNWVFANRSSEVDHRWTGPIIDHGAPRQPLTLRAFHPVRGFPAMDEADIPRAYAALRRFSEVSHDPELQIRYPFTPGDLVGFDNRRVLHGRDPFDAGGGSRYLRGCYIDHDDLHSKVRVLRRRSAAPMT